MTQNKTLTACLHDILKCHLCYSNNDSTAFSTMAEWQ